MFTTNLEMNPGFRNLVPSFVDLWFATNLEMSPGFRNLVPGIRNKSLATDALVGPDWFNGVGTLCWSGFSPFWCSSAYLPRPKK